MNRMSRTSRAAGKGIIAVLLGLGAFLMFVPFLWLFVTAFKTPPEMNVWPPKLLPKSFSLDNFVKVFETAPFYLFFLNSLFMSLLSCATIVATSTLAGYIFAKFRFFGKTILFAFILATAIVPFEIYMLPLFIQMRALSLVDTFLGLVMPYFVMSFGIFLMRQNILQQIPDELIECARVEGCSEWRIFGTIVVPLSTQAMSALGIFAFLQAWNTFVWPLLIVNSKDLYTMELGLAMFQTSYNVDISLVSAGSFLSILPIFLVFLFLRRYIMDSIAMTGFK